ncbi:MAG: STAS domain-containing protein [Sphaerochaetaceae bacterium]
MVALEELYFELKERGVNLLFCGIQPGVKKQFYRSEFNNVVGEENIFNNAVEAIDTVADS